MGDDSMHEMRTMRLLNADRIARLDPSVQSMDDGPLRSAPMRAAQSLPSASTSE